MKSKITKGDLSHKYAIFQNFLRKKTPEKSNTLSQAKEKQDFTQKERLLKI